MFTTPELQAAFEREGVKRLVPAGTVVMHAGDRITHIPLGVSGSLRILACDEEGRERFLYHIMPGESCAMTLACCAAERTRAIVAVAEEDTEMRLLPVRAVEEWMNWPEWRKFVGGTQAQRFNELLEAIEN